MRWGNFAAFMSAVAIVAAASDARALTSPAATRASCTVVGGEKLPAEVGGADALCDAIRRAVSAEAGDRHFTAELKVVSPSVLAARLIVDGRVLAEQRLAVMDRNLNMKSIEQFAESLATKVAQAAKPTPGE
jgi:hypothetical protein